MRVISKNPKFPNFWAEHPDAEAPLMAWYRMAKHAEWENFADVRATAAATVSQVGRFTVFNIGGNKYRLITLIRYDRGRIYVREILTHKDYDRAKWKNQ